MNDYIQMLTFKRPSFSASEEIFINKFLRPLGTKPDAYGNQIVTIGDRPNIMWSCHTDTVHYHEGLQKVEVVGDFVGLHPNSKSNCLGADCTSGVWLMTEMIKAKKPGLYIFHRDEENGGGGSSWIAKNNVDLFKDIDAAIAFDRYGTKSIITHQFSRCCSDDFANSLAEQLPGTEKDPDGLFTDTANYTDLISECTNISVGYYGHHTARENQDLNFLKSLRDKMIALDTNKLRFSRDVNDHSYPVWSNHSPDPWMNDSPEKGLSLLQMIKLYPDAVADLLDLYGITARDIEEHLYETAN